MSYDSIDSIIYAWVQRYGFTLFDRVQGSPGHSFRTVYLSSDRGECFQIWIDRPQAEQVSLHAASVETRADEELRQDWSVPVRALDQALDDAVRHVQCWMER